jgi:predicted nucleic acid-binding protein
MAFLFDTDAISELLRPTPVGAYVRWLAEVPRAEQFTSAVVVGELIAGAWRSPRREHHLAMLDERVLSVVTILPVDAAVARAYGCLRAELERSGRALSDVDAHVAATAIHHGLALVTGLPARFDGIRGLALEPILAKARGIPGPVGSGLR